MATKSLLSEMGKQKSTIIPPFNVLHSPSSCVAVIIFMCAKKLYLV